MKLVPVEPFYAVGNRKPVRLEMINFNPGMGAPHHYFLAREPGLSDHSPVSQTELDGHWIAAKNAVHIAFHRLNFYAISACKFACRNLVRRMGERRRRPKKEQERDNKARRTCHALAAVWRLMFKRRWSNQDQNLCLKTWAKFDSIDFK